MRVILADDAAVIREGVARLLIDRGVQVAAQVGTPDELVKAVERERPDLAIVDIRMPPSFTNEGLAAAAQIRAANPDVGVLILSQHVDSQYALRLLAHEHERIGYLLKDRVLDVDELIAAMRRICAGGCVVDESLIAQLMDDRHDVEPLAALTARELEVLALMAEGRTDRGIAERLFITQKTVEAHVRSILRKLDLPANAAHNRRVHAVLAFLGRARERTGTNA